MYCSYVYIRKDRNLLRGMWRRKVWLNISCQNKDTKLKMKMTRKTIISMFPIWGWISQACEIAQEEAQVSRDTHPAKKNDFSRYHNWFPYKMTPGELYERRNSTLMTHNYPGLGSASYWMTEQFFSTIQKHYSILGSNNATLVWSFSARWFIYGRYIRANAYRRRIFPLEFFKFLLSLKTIKHSSGQLRQ